MVESLLAVCDEAGLQNERIEIVTVCFIDVFSVEITEC